MARAKKLSFEKLQEIYRSTEDAGKEPTMAKKTEVQDVVRCRRFELVDDAGKVRMVAEVSTGVTRLQLFDGNGNERFFVAAYPGDPKTYGPGQAEVIMSCKDGKATEGYRPVWQKV